jgi:hypothetical protein
MKPPLPLALGLLLLASSALADHRDNDDRREGARVIIYQHAGYRGDALVLYPGESIDNLSGKTFENGAKLNDSISSIWVEGGAEVYAYENSRYRGEALRLTENARDLSGRLVSGSVSVSWNDRISSIKVERPRSRDRDREPDRPRDNPRGNPDKSIKDSFNDLLGREPSAGEWRLFREKFNDQGWTERMLRDHLRREDSYRMEAADRIIHRAYRDTLGRDPDESGLRTYRRNLLDREWTESDVRDDLRKSAEFRNRPRN